MASGRENVRYGMIRPIRVLNSPMSRHSLKIGAAMVICGNVVIDRMIARITNLNLIFRRASAYAQNAPTTSESSVVTSETIALLRNADVKFESLKIDSKFFSVGLGGSSDALDRSEPVLSDVFTSQ